MLKMVAVHQKFTSPILKKNQAVQMNMLPSNMIPQAWATAGSIEINKGAIDEWLSSVT